MGGEVSARFSLWLISFLGCAVQYMLLMNLNIAVTDMVDRSPDTNVSNRNNSVVNYKKFNSQGKFLWDEEEEALVLGSAYWLLWASHLVGGVISHALGPKVVIHGAIFLASGLNLFIPAAVFIHFKLLLLVRAVQGFFIGSAYPSIIPAIQFWIPESERSKFVTCLLGAGLGSAATYFISGITIELFNWETVFYVNGLIGLLWCMAWNYFMYDRPEQHPRISETERLFIHSQTKASLADSTQNAHKPVPWSQILTSTEVIVNCIAQFGVLWYFLMVTMYGPKYMKLFHNLDAVTTGLLTGIPHLVRLPITIVYAAYADKLIREKTVSTTNVRKLSMFICLILPAFSVAILGCYGHHFYIALVMFTLTIALSGTTLVGGTAGLIDISPTFGGLYACIKSTTDFIKNTIEKLFSTIEF